MTKLISEIELFKHFNNYFKLYDSFGIEQIDMKKEFNLLNSNYQHILNLLFEGKIFPKISLEDAISGKNLKERNLDI